MAVRRSLRRVAPDVFVSVESEIWPNFLAAAKSMGVQTLIVSGIVSDKTVSRSRWLRFLYRWALSNVDRCLMQTEGDAERIVGLGADAGRVEVVGNCKFDQEKEGLTDEETAALRHEYGSKRSPGVRSGEH